jgi:hypothetical protein
MEATLTRNKNKHKTRIDWDLNIYCPEQWYGGESSWDAELWNINARIYMPTDVIDTEYSLTLLPKEAQALGLVQWAQEDNPEADSLDGWLDRGLDGFISLAVFMEEYRSRCSDRVLDFLEQLPQYVEDVPARMRY